MARRGRPRKAGKRTAGDRLQARAPSYVPPSDWTRERYSVYGADGSDAIGRAYVEGLLGENGLELRNLARKIHRAYWPMFGQGREKSCLGLDVNGQAVNDNLLDPEEREYKIRREKRLTETLRSVARLGASHRKAFDQLCIDINPDEGPAWVDGLIWAKKHGREPELAHTQALELAIAALEHIAPEWG